ncbi:ATP-binding cassette domain-containing protein [Peredibacter starrii]|uniref:ATP-binding cassette domain-containing protein n=1 Tax=Peredibacter starrii TaxID=28202 RepID=A0AAX4HTQ9_9BACT|nr:ATP-binding cassette domain-containing protein [Peredibacter starrii]WPU66330.1 ATP-binding cassette domain-containing protein [Peredibacter starrii]
MYKFKITDPHFLPHCACDVELTVSPGEVVTLVGENGLGKSTLMNRLWQTYAHDMTYVEQKPLDLFYDRPLRKIKDVLLKSRADKIDKEFFASLWKRFGLEQKETRLHSSLSGGEGQALKISLALAQMSQCYLLDEPSQFLDVNMKQVLSAVVSELQAKQKSIVLVEHDKEWIRHSRFVQLGVVDETLKEVKSWTI